MHRLEIIGEASRNLSDAFLEQYPDIPWQDIIGMRNRTRACVLRGGLAGGLGHSEN